MFLGDMACQGGFGGEVCGGAGLPLAFCHAFDQVDGFQVFLEVRAGGEGGAAYGAARHQPLAGSGRAGCADSRE
jgi:hypothetical protein